MRVSIKDITEENINEVPNHVKLVYTGKTQLSDKAERYHKQKEIKYEAEKAI